MRRPVRFFRAALAGMMLPCAIQAEPVAPAAQAGGIATAKTDFDAIKDARTTQGQPALVLPSMPTLDLKSADTAPPPAAAGAKGAGSTKPNSSASSNWLVDAMANPARATGDLSKTPGSAPEAKAGLVLARGDFIENAQRLDAERMRSLHSEKTEPRLDREKAEIPNPLSTFMASWMTLKDFKLLAAAPADEQRTTESLASGFETGSSQGEAPGIDTPGPFGGEGVATVTAAPPANPYLAAMIEPLAPGDSRVTREDIATVAPVAPAAPVPANAVSPVPDPPRPPGLEEFLKAQNDQKYFKPLKRF